MPKVNPKKDCRKCAHMAVFTSEGGQTIRICWGYGWEDQGDGCYCLTEISEFDPKECILFKVKP